ncbi:MAG: enoyl-CoA hydratase [Deltaproteobacteria bacterium]|nr:enoyl-CoA hydratase [Deltaproteobacteria bacterium]
MPGRRELDTGTETLLAHVEDGVAVITLNRPEARNALSDELSPAFRDLLAVIPQDPEIRAVMVTGAGTAFCAGGDVKGMGGGAKRQGPAATREDAVAELTRRQRRLTGALYDLPQPTLASLPGPAAGAGLSIALACDLRIMADDTFVTTGFKNVGLSGDYGASFFLTQLVGSSRARELFFSSERVDAARCEQLGIVNRVVPAAQLRERALAWARELAAGPTTAYRHMKENLDRALRDDLSTCLAHEAEGIVATAATADHREAVEAFAHKRKPEFSGR